MILADSICANKAFTESFRREMAAIFPDHPLEPIPAGDPLLTTVYGGFDLATVSRRDPQPGSATGRSASSFAACPRSSKGSSSATATGWSFRSST